MVSNSRLRLLLVLACAGSGAWGQNQVVGPIQTVSPGDILTLTTTAIDVPDAVATQIPLPTSLSGVSVQVRVVGALKTTGYPAVLPVLRVRTLKAIEMHDGAPCPSASTPANIFCSSTDVTVEIPTEGVCAPRINGPPETCSTPPFNDLPPLLILNVTANGVTGPDYPLQVLSSWPYEISYCPPGGGNCSAAITHADGSLVSQGDSNPAHVGETITVYAAGLGLDSKLNSPPTGTAPTVPLRMFGGGVTSLAAMVFTYNYPLPGGAAPTVWANSQSVVNPVWAGLIPGYVGPYQVNITVPPAPSQSYPACGVGGNAGISFLPTSSITEYVCIQP